jgi:hypothetical protein
LKFCFKAENIINLKFFIAISLQFFKTFPALWSLFRTVFKILNKYACHNFLHRWFNVSIWETFLSANSWISETVRSQLEPSQKCTAEKTSFLAKNCTWSKQCASMLMLWRLNEQSPTNSPRLCLMVSISLFNVYM